MTERLGFDEHLAAIETEASRLGAVAAGALDHRVPTCPEWSGRDLVEHVASTFTFWTHQLAAADPSERHDPPPYDGGSTAPDPVEWLDASSSILLESLAQLGPDQPSWNWSGANFTSGWVARRMALEVAVHRYDGERAAGEASPVATELAVDGIDERLEVHLRADVPEFPSASLGGPLCLACSDADAAWVVEVGSGKLRVRCGTGPARAVLKGPASALFLFSWNRLGPDSLELTGDASVGRAWATLPV